MREAYQKIRLNVNISWEPGSQVPREFAALTVALPWVWALQKDILRSKAGLKYENLDPGQGWSMKI